MRHVPDDMYQVPGTRYDMPQVPVAKRGIEPGVIRRHRPIQLSLSPSLLWLDFDSMTVWHPTAIIVFSFKFIS
jgi:hypothetical protein